MPRAPRPRFDELPLFASDEEIGAALLGPARAREFTGIATVLERKGFPAVNLLWGGRYTPAIRAFLDKEHSLTTVVPTSAPQGMENPDAWTRPKRKHRA